MYELRNYFYSSPLNHVFYIKVKEEMLSLSFTITALSTSVTPIVETPGVTTNLNERKFPASQLN